MILNFAKNGNSFCDFGAKGVHCVDLGEYLLANFGFDTADN